MISSDPSIRTLRHAIRALSSTSMLLYHQRIDIRNVYADQGYSCYIHHRPEHEILTLTFPRECETIFGLTNNYGCKMVYYITVNGFLKEIEITSDMGIDVDHTTSITFYTRSKPDLVISFDMILSKIRSKL